MGTSRHDRRTIEGFLDRDFRQVWAVDRVTGEPRYLPEGSADELRAVAKQVWRCPVPGCSVEISTRGKSRRDHFFHVGTAPHKSDGESDAHLAAKAMIAEWATSKMPPGCSVREEETIKDPATAMHRIADVMITWPDGEKTAYEVEYKQFAAESWSIKQANYASVNLPCAWILGHTRLTAVPERSHGVGDWSNAVKMPNLGRAFATAGRHVLVINPTEKLIGTLGADQNFTSRPGKCDTEAWLALDPISDCDIDPILGIITPTMRHIDDAIKRHEAREALAERNALARKQRTLEPSKPPEYYEALKVHQAEIWDASRLKAEMTERWGRIPAQLAGPTSTPHGICANPTHWHAYIYETFLHNRTPHETFTIAEIKTHLLVAGIRCHREYRIYFRALIEYLEQLAVYQLLEIHRDHHGYVHHLTPTGHNIEDLPRLLQEQREAKHLADQQRAARHAEEHAQLIAKQEAERETAQQEAKERREREESTKKQLIEQWQTSEIQKTVLQAFGDVIPDFIKWSAVTEEERAINALPAHWHACLFMRHIYQQPKGTLAVVADSMLTLESDGITFASGGEQATQAVRDYLYNLRQRGILAHGREPGSYVVA